MISSRIRAFSSAAALPRAAESTLLFVTDELRFLTPVFPLLLLFANFFLNHVLLVILIDIIQPAMPLK